MWYLSGGIFVATMSVWFRKHNVEPSLISISTALVFVLPSVCNSQPGILSVTGTTSDMVGFFWNLLLVTSTLCNKVIVLSINRIQVLSWRNFISVF
jgi:hypothetical protein